MRAKNKFSGRGSKPNDSRYNPLNLDGTVSECAICGSKMYWAKRCPHAHERTLYLEEKTSDDCEEVQTTLMATSMDTDKMNLLLGETLRCALLDSVCSKTVCGVEWLAIYLET